MSQTLRTHSTTQNARSPHIKARVEVRDDGASRRTLQPESYIYWLKQVIVRLANTCSKHSLGGATTRELCAEVNANGWPHHKSCDQCNFNSNYFVSLYFDQLKITLRMARTMMMVIIVPTKVVCREWAHQTPLINNWLGVRRAACHRPINLHLIYRIRFDMYKKVDNTAKDTRGGRIWHVSNRVVLFECEAPQSDWTRTPPTQHAMHDSCPSVGPFWHEYGASRSMWHPRHVGQTSQEFAFAFLFLLYSVL